MTASSFSGGHASKKAGEKLEKSKHVRTDNDLNFIVSICFYGAKVKKISFL